MIGFGFAIPIIAQARQGVVVANPQLISVHAQFRGLNAYFTLVEWQPNGKVQFVCQNLSQVGQGATSQWSVEGTTDAAGVACLGTMIIGDNYGLRYRLDCIPDVPGWDEGLARWMGVTWTQPISTEPVDIDYSNPP